MGKSLELGVNLVDLLKEHTPIDKVGYFIADALFFETFKKQNVEFTRQKAMLLKEWEFTSIDNQPQPNLDLIEKYENMIGDPSLWNAVMADRRIFFGKYCKVKQDYPSRYSLNEIMAILEKALVATDHFIRTLNPEVVISFGMATLGDYLIYLFAKKMGIQYLLLKSTKIKNYVMLYDDPLDLSSIEESIRTIGKIPDPIKLEIQTYISEIYKKGLKYEGAIISDRQRLSNRIWKSPGNLARSIKYTYLMLRDPLSRNDNHTTSSTINTIYTDILNPLRAIHLQSRLSKHVKHLEKSALKQIGRFIFYPLHFEPEVSLQVLGKPYQNQIEVIRNLAMAAPVNMKIVVKEHPRSLGFRPFSYYKKLFEIPNVYIVNPFLNSHEIIPYSTIVAVITGTIGFEAAILKKPVLTFGLAPYNLLPDSMVRKITNLNDIGSTIVTTLKEYQFNREALDQYIAAFMQDSVAVDLYSILLKKGNRYAETKNDMNLSDQERIGYGMLAQYLTKKIECCTERVK